MQDTSEIPHTSDHPIIIGDEQHQSEESLKKEHPHSHPTSVNQGRSRLRHYATFPFHQDVPALHRFFVFVNPRHDDAAGRPNPPPNSTCPSA